MISLVIPTLNEVDNIAPLLTRIARCDPALDQIIFVDDGSNDGTRECIRSLAGSAPIELIERDAPSLGLAGAVIGGARAAAGEWLVVMDADLSHPPEKIAELLQPLLEGRADIVIGSRYVKDGATPGWPVWRKILSRIAAAFAYPLTGVHRARRARSGAMLSTSLRVGMTSEITIGMEWRGLLPGRRSAVCR